MMVQQFPDCSTLPLNIFARFIMGYQYDYTEATNRFTPYFAWAKKTNILELQPEDFPQIHLSKPFTIIGRTREGHGVILLQLKNLKIKGMNHDDFSKYVGAIVNNTLRTADPSLDTYYMIIDVKDYTKDNFDMEGLKKLTPIFSNYFPDVLFRMALINLGFFASNMFSLVMMFMHEVTRKKIKIVKENVQLIKSTLLEDIDLDTIPVAYGGNNTIQLG